MPTPYYDASDPLASYAGGPSWKQWASQGDDPLAERSSWSSWSQPIYDYTNQNHGGLSWAPQGRGELFAPTNVEFGTKAQYDADWNSWMQASFPELFVYGDMGPGSNPGEVGNPNDTDWAPVNAWNNDIMMAARKVQEETGVYVPPNVIKAIMKIESGGHFNEGQGQESPHGARGLLQVTESTMGQYDYARLATDAAYGIYAGTKELALRYQDSGKMPWENVAVGYFSGHYTPNGSDDGFNSDFQYQQAFLNNMKALGGAAGAVNPLPPGTAGNPGGTPATGNPANASKLFNSIWGGWDAPISQEYGLTEFSLGAGAGMYEYTTGYTPDGSYGGHIGLDVGITAGTQLYAPLAGEIICAGTDNGNGKDSCSAYSSNVYTPGMEGTSGRLELLLPGGDVIIFGHVKDSTVRPGDMVIAGQPIGHSGSQNGDHVHVEYRQKNPACSSGYCAVDPRDALVGNFSGVYGQGGSSATGDGGFALVANTSNWGSFMQAVASGRPLGDQNFGGGGWNQELRRLMGQVPTTSEDQPVSWLWGTEPNPASAADSPNAPR